MAAHKYTSWGRTRSPKALSANVPSVSRPATGAVVTTVAAGDLSDTLAGTNAGENGYSTENQRFLHIMIIDDSAGGESLTLYAYNYAFQKWAKYYIPVGVKNAADTTAELSYVAATIEGINGNKYIVVPIDGVDRIAFVDDGTHDANFVVYAACSTF